MTREPAHCGHDPAAWVGDFLKLLQHAKHTCGSRYVLPRCTRVFERRRMGAMAVNVMPNVRAKLPAEARSVSLVRDDARCAADQAYAACRSGSA